MRSPHTIGDAWARPGIGVCQEMFSPVATFQVVGRAAESSTPLAPGPRCCGQFAAERETVTASKRAIVAKSRGRFLMCRLEANGAGAQAAQTPIKSFYRRKQR